MMNHSVLWFSHLIKGGLGVVERKTASPSAPVNGIRSGRVLVEVHLVEPVIPAVESVRAVLSASRVVSVVGTVDGVVAIAALEHVFAVLASRGIVTSAAVEEVSVWRLPSPSVPEGSAPRYFASVA